MSDTIVVKCCCSNAEQTVATCWDVAELAFNRHRLVLVHDDCAGTLDLIGSTKSHLLTAFEIAGVEAVGLTGLDAGLLRAHPPGPIQAHQVLRSDSPQDGELGNLTQVNSRVLTALLDVGVVPVVSPLALARDGIQVNVSSDHVASAVAVALRASTLVLLVTETRPSIDLTDRADLTWTPEQAPVEASLRPPGEHDRSRTELLACAREALRHGVGRVVIADGRGTRPVTRALNNHGADVRPGNPAAGGSCSEDLVIVPFVKGGARTERVTGPKPQPVVYEVSEVST